MLYVRSKPSDVLMLILLAECCIDRADVVGGSCMFNVVVDLRKNVWHSVEVYDEDTLVASVARD